jgi:hypothetical protein
MHSCGLHEPSREGRCLGGRGFGLGRRQRFQILEPSVPADENAAGRFDRGKPGSSGRSIGRFSHSGPAQELGLRVDLAASDRIVRCCACHRSASVRGGLDGAKDDEQFQLAYWQFWHFYWQFTGTSR